MLLTFSQALDIVIVSTADIQQQFCSQSHLTELFCQLQFTGEVTPHVLLSKLFKLIMTSVKLCVTFLFSVSLGGKEKAHCYVPAQKRSNPQPFYFT